MYSLQIGRMWCLKMKTAPLRCPVCFSYDTKTENAKTQNMPAHLYVHYPIIVAFSSPLASSSSSLEAIRCSIPFLSLLNTDNGSPGLEFSLLLALAVTGSPHAKRKAQINNRSRKRTWGYRLPSRGCDSLLLPPLFFFLPRFFLFFFPSPLLGCGDSSPDCCLES